jgi:anthranilate synthase, component I (EC 4.1.3.27)
MAPAVTEAQFDDALSTVSYPAVGYLHAPLPMVDPLDAYRALTRSSPHGFLLESGAKIASSDPAGAFVGDEAPVSHARFSYIGLDPIATIAVTGGSIEIDVHAPRFTEPFSRLRAAAAEVEGDVLDRLRAIVSPIDASAIPARPPYRFSGGLVGFLAYESVYDIWLDEVGVERPETSRPDAVFAMTTTTVAVDHHADEAALIHTPLMTSPAMQDAAFERFNRRLQEVRSALTDLSPAAPATGTFHATDEDMDRLAYERAVSTTIDHIERGDIYQGVVARARSFETDLDPTHVYDALRAINPSPYMYLLSDGDRQVIGASPETLVSVRDGRVVVNPIAGTCARGGSPVEDRRLAGEMLADDKERAEHTMLVDLARNDVRRVAEAGSVRVDAFMEVIKYSHVQHIESTVSGRLAPRCDAFDAVRATFPAGTLTGAPKLRAMEIIHALEEGPRGVYGGGVGYWSWSGDADFAIVIRTATMADGRVAVRAGAGVVADSDPAAEYAETEQKMGAVLSALKQASTEES